MRDRRAEILDAALALIDEEGVGALSMRRLAARAGIGTMTLYGYFDDKERLLDAVVAHAAADVAPPAEGTWQERVRAIARGWHAELVRHPGLVQARLRRPLMGPQVFRSTEAGLAALVEAGFDPAAAARAFRVLFLYVFGSAGFNEPELSSRRSREVQAAVLSLPEEQFPVLGGMGRELAATLGGEAQFEFGLDVLIAGLEAAIA